MGAYPSGQRNNVGLPGNVATKAYGLRVKTYNAGSNPVLPQF